MNREQIYAALFAKLSALSNLTASNEVQTVDSGAQIYPLWSNRFVANISVINKNTGVPLTPVGSSPASGQYTIANGIYGFNSADIGIVVYVNYTFKGIVTAARALKDLTMVSPEDTPALFQLQTGETNQQTRGLPTKWTLMADIYIYINTSNNPYLIPSQLINPIIDQVEAMLPPSQDAEYTETLGGLVNRCWMSSPVRIFEGDIGTEAAVIIPIAMIVP